MSKEFKGEFGPDPELYTRMSAPYEDANAAHVAIERFLSGVKRLREECRVSEVLVVVAAPHVSLEKGAYACQQLTLGNPSVHAEMAATAFNTYALPVIERAERLREMATIAKSDSDES